MASVNVVLLEKREGVAWIALDRPEKLNAYNTQMRDELYQALEAVQDDPEVRVAVLRGEGRAFCAGADLTEFGTAPSQAVARQVRWERDVWGLFLEVGKPLIAALHGYVLGAGLEMALLCDLRVADETAVLGVPEVGLGMVPAAGGTQTLPRLLGPSRALELLLTGRRLSAQEALDMGLVTAVVPAGTHLAEAEAVARRLAALDPRVVRAAREAVYKGMEMPLPAGLELERRLALAVLASRPRP